MERRRKIHDLPTPEQVKELLSYDPESGTLTWKRRAETDRFTRAWNTRRADKLAGTVNNHGRLIVSILGRLYSAHRLMWLLMMGEWPDTHLDIDHKDGNPGNNRWSNLRLATDSENKANTKLRVDNRVGLKGVGLDKRDGRYQARIRIRGRRFYIGRFATAEEAHAAFVATAQRYFGEYAYDGLSDRRSPQAALDAYLAGDRQSDLVLKYFVRTSVPLPQESERLPAKVGGVT
jgi:hypothetical protein